MNMCRRDPELRYFWGEGCEGWHLLAHEQLSVIEERVPAGSHEVNHRHVHARQFFYVLDGQASMLIGEQRFELAAGEGLHVPPGVMHQFRNDSTSDVRVLVISAPPSHGDRIEAPA
jgi:mannose-6-phosphate isomerase-like protein (cupin superfamily)